MTAIRSVAVLLTLLYLNSCQGGYLEDVCLLAVDPGKACSGTSSTVQYHFSKEKEECVAFLFKGCGGNDNRFTLQDDCTDACQVEYFRKKNKKKGGTDEDEEASTNADCKLGPVPGPCRALINQWYFDGKSGKCKTFTYGGCNGNKNRFNTEAQCLSICGNG